jgi:hypothetical protein
LNLALSKAVSMAMARQFLGATPRRWLEYLAAILLGNLIYFFSLMPHLPASLKHVTPKTDWGTFVDFLVCVAVYALIRLGSYVHHHR